MATFTLNWDNSLVLAEVNAIDQRVSYRKKDIGNPWITTGFTPANDLATTDVTASVSALDTNLIYEFKVEALCTSGGPTANDNGIVEQIVFECSSPLTLSSTTTTITASVDYHLFNITKIRFTLRLVSDNSLVATYLTTNSLITSTSHTFIGLTQNTGYYVEYELYTTINYVEVCSSDVDYLNDVCGGDVISTDAVTLPNIIFTLKLDDPGHLMDLTGKLNGTFSLIDWGDGTINTSWTHTYGAGTFIVQIYDSTTTIFKIGSKFAPNVDNIISWTKGPNTIVDILVSQNPSLSIVPPMSSFPSLYKCWMFETQLTSVPDFSSNVILQELLIGSDLGGLINGTYNFSANTQLNLLEFQYNSITGVTGFTPLALLGSIDASYNNISVSDINNILIALDSNGITNGYCILNNQTPAATPTGLGATAKLNLISKGWIVTTD